MSELVVDLNCVKPGDRVFFRCGGSAVVKAKSIEHLNRFTLEFEGYFDTRSYAKDGKGSTYGSSAAVNPFLLEITRVEHKPPPKCGVCEELMDGLRNLVNRLEKTRSAT